MVQVATAGEREVSAGHRVAPLSSARWRGRGWPGGKGCAWESADQQSVLALLLISTLTESTLDGPFADTATDHHTRRMIISPYFTDTWAQTGHGRCQGCGRSKVYKYTNEPRVLQCPNTLLGEGTENCQPAPGTGR